MTLLASWLLQNYFTAQFNGRVRIYFLPPREKPKQEHLPGLLTHHRRPVNYSLPSAGSGQGFPDTIITLPNSFYQNVAPTLAVFL